MPYFQKMPYFPKNALTLSGPDVPAWAPEGREGRSQKARRPTARSQAPDGPLDFFDIIIIIITMVGRCFVRGEQVAKSFLNLSQMLRLTSAQDIG